MSQIIHPVRAARILAAVIAVVALSGLGGLPLSASADGTAPGSIGGVVTDSATHQPVAGITVSAHASSSSASWVKPQTSDASGYYQFTGLQLGDYSLQFSDSGSVYQSSSISGVSLTSAAPAATENIAITKWPTGTGTISGTVVDAAGNPLVGASLSFMGSVSSRSNVISDGNGHFEFTQVPADTDYVMVYASGYIEQTQTVDTNNDEVVMKPFVLVAADATVTGMATDEAGDPVSGLFLTFTSAGGNGVARTATDGSYTTDAFGAGNYTVTFGGAGTSWVAQSLPLTVRSGSTTLDLDLVQRITGSIRGRIVDAAGDVIAGECILLTDASTGLAVSASGGLSDVNGQYTASDLEAGQYFIRVRTCDGAVDYGTTYLGGDSPAEATVVTLDSGANISVADITVAPAASISGHVDVVTPTGLAPVPANHGFQETIFQWSGNSWIQYDLGVGNEVGIDASGNYTIGRLPAGQYRVAFIDPLVSKRAYTGQFWSATTPAGAASLASATSITLAAGEELSGRDAHLTSPRPASAPDAAATDTFTAAQQGQITATGTVTSGAQLTVTVGASHVGEWVSVWGHSTPTLMGNWTQVAKDGTVTVTVPTSLEAGAHRLIALTADDQVIGWQPLVVNAAELVAPHAALTAPGNSAASSADNSASAATSIPSASPAPSESLGTPAAPHADGITAGNRPLSPKPQPVVLIVLAALAVLAAAAVILLRARTRARRLG